MEEQRVVWPCVFDQPMHRSQDVGFSRLAHGVLLVVGQRDHVLPLVAKELVQVCAHVLHIVDAAAKLSSLAEVVDTDQEGFPSTVACRVLKRIAVGCAVAEVLCARGRWWGRVVVSMCPLIAVGCGHDAWTGRLLWRRWAVVAILLWWWWSLCKSASTPAMVSLSACHMRTWLYPYCCGGGVG